MKKEIGIAGGGRHAWVSVDRTRRFYLDALKEKFDIIFIDNLEQLSQYKDLEALLNFAGNIGWELPERPDYPVLYCAHGGAILNQSFLYNQLPHLRSTDGIIINCQSDADIFKNMCEGITPALYRLPLPANQEMFQPIDKAIAKDIFGIAEDTIVIGHICRLLPQKNLHSYLRMVKVIKERLPDKQVKGIVVGNFWIDYPVLDYVTDTYPSYIETLVKDLGLEEDVTIMSASLSEDELICCYNALDLLIHPTHSLDENFGYVPVEAMACGVPVLGSAYGGLKDTIKDGVTGYLMPTWVTDNGIRMDEPYGVARAVELLSQPSPNGMFDACVNRVDHHFSYSHCASLLCEYVEKSIDTYKTASSEPVQIRQQQEKAPKETQLPSCPSGTTWQKFYNVVARYVSQPCPAFSEGCKVYPAAPLIYTSNQTITLDDPAWPATYTLTAGQLDFLKKIALDGLSFSSATNEEREQANQWLQNGLLSLTKENTNGLPEYTYTLERQERATCMSG